jgi:mannosyltransferase
VSVPATASSQFAPAHTAKPLSTVGRLRASRSAQVVLALTVFAAALRFGTLDVQSAWLDESATIVLVRRGLGGMLSHLSASESTPPLYYTLVWAWTKVFGTGVIGFRSFSALVGTLTVPVMYLAGRRISPRVGCWAAALTAVNPAMYYYSQEARAYALLILFSAAAVVFWGRALDSGDRRALGWWTAMSILALLTHYFAVFLFIPEAVILVSRLGLRRVRLAIGATVLTGVALLPLAANERRSGQSNWIEASSLLSRTAEAPKQFLVGLYGPQEIVTALVTGLLAAGAVALIVYRAGARERELARQLAIVAAAAVLVPLLLAFSHVFDAFDGRNVIAGWVPCALVVAIGIAGTGARRAGAAVGFGICLVSLLVIIGIDTKPAYQRDDWRAVARGLPAHASGAVVVTPANSLLPLGIYVPALQKTGSSSVSTREVEFVALRVRQTGRAPSAAIVPTTAPTGFRPAGVKRTETYAISRFVAPRPINTSTNALRRMSSEAESEVLIRR